MVRTYPKPSSFLLERVFIRPRPNKVHNTQHCISTSMCDTACEHPCSCTFSAMSAPLMSVATANLTMYLWKSWECSTARVVFRRGHGVLQDRLFLHTFLFPTHTTLFASASSAQQDEQHALGCRDTLSIERRNASPTRLAAPQIEEPESGVLYMRGNWALPVGTSHRRRCTRSGRSQAES